ncbi:MAG: hypothetical protein ABR514_04425 [Chthoniobacterales bacterium]
MIQPVMPANFIHRCASLAHIAAIACAVFVFYPASNTYAQQPVTAEDVVITGEEIPSAYGAPPGISRTRFSPLLTAYVLPPWTFFFGELYEGDIFRHGPPDHIFTQEVEMGLPYRFGIAAEGAFERFNGGGGPSTASIEARYALADWNKIPLNPTIFAEYKFGTGPIRHEEIMAPPGEGGEEEEEEEEEGGPPERPDAYEFRLLLAEDFGNRVEWAMNWFFEQEVTGDEGREWGFAQAAVMPILLPNERLKVGLEMQYKNFTTKFTRDDAENSFVVGPTLAWKPSRSTRIDVSPLFGCTDDSPRVQVFAIFSWLLGPAGGPEAEAPASTRNR